MGVDPIKRATEWVGILFVWGIGAAYVGVSEGRDPRASAGGVLRAFEAVGSTYVDEVRINNAPSFKAGFDGTAAVLGGSRDPDLVYLVSDHLAFGGGGLRRGRKACTGGYRDRRLQRPGYKRGLGADTDDVENPARSMGLTAARLVVSRIRGARNLDRVVMPVELIAGQTTRDKRKSDQEL